MNTGIDTQKVPVICVDSSQIGPLGVTLGNTDAGGGAGSELIMIPLLITGKWFDHRQTCRQVVAFVQFDALPDLSACAMYHAGQCDRGGQCAFTEGPNADIWHLATDWLPAPDGSAMVHRNLWPEFGLEHLRGPK